MERASRPIFPRARDAQQTVLSIKYQSCWRDRCAEEGRRQRARPMWPFFWAWYCTSAISGCVAALSATRSAAERSLCQLNEAFSRAKS